MRWRWLLGAQGAGAQPGTHRKQQLGLRTTTDKLALCLIGGTEQHCQLVNRIWLTDKLTRKRR